MVCVDGDPPDIEILDLDRLFRMEVAELDYQIPWLGVGTLKDQRSRSVHHSIGGAESRI